MYVGLTLVGVMPSNANSIAAGTPVTSKASPLSALQQIANLKLMAAMFGLYANLLA